MPRTMGVLGCVLVLTFSALIGVVTPASAAQALPSVSSVAPNSGKLVAGTRVTVTGTHFLHVMSVTFGGRAGTRVRVLSSTKLQVTAPAHAAGVVNVRVRTPAGTSSIRTADHYAFVAPPVIASVSPSSGPTTGGTRVTITGARFIHVTGIRFGTTAGTSIKTLSTTKVQVTAPTGATGPIGIRVTTTYGVSPVVTADHFTYVAPGVPPVSALTAKASTATSIHLSWTNPTGVTVTGQVVRRAIGTTPPTTVNSGSAGTTISGDGSTYIDTGLKPGTRYSYAVFAVTAKGTSTTSPSATATTLSPSTITGTVTAAAGGAPLAGVRVEVYQAGDYTPSSAARGTAVTGADGTYTVTGIEPGLQYGVCFDASGVEGGNSTGYQDQCWSGVAWDGGLTPTANLFTLNPATVTSDINAALLAGGAIAGTVSASGPLAGVTVRLYEQMYESPAPILRTTVTAADGTYTFDGLTPYSDGYVVCFEDSVSSSYQPQCWNDTPWTDLNSVPSPTAHVQVTAGTTQGGINAVLAPGGNVTGTITASADGTPLAGVAVSLSDSDGNTVAQATTAADGTYTLRGIPAGTTYSVCANPQGVLGTSQTGYLRACAPSSATVTVGATTSGIDVALPSAAGVSGTVTAAIGGSPLSGVQVEVGQLGLLPGLGVWVGATTRADGTYSVVGLPPPPAGQSYSVYFGGAGAAGGESMTGYTSSSQGGVSVTSGVFTTIDATLQSAGAITGTVTALDGGAPLQRVAVELYDPSGGSLVGTTTDANGFYTLPALPPTTSGGYKVCFDPANAIGGASTTGYVGNCYNNVGPWQGSAFPSGIASVPVTAQTVTGSIDATLKTGGAISGSVTHQGNPVANAPVFWCAVGSSYCDFLVNTDANGNYKAIGLPPSTTGYTICFGPSDTSGTQSPTCYNNQPWVSAPIGPPPAAATPVPVSNGSTTTGINGTL